MSNDIPHFFLSFIHVVKHYRISKRFRDTTKMSAVPCRYIGSLTKNKGTLQKKKQKNCDNRFCVRAFFVLSHTFPHKTR